MSEDIDYKALYEKEMAHRIEAQVMLKQRTSELSTSLDTIQQQFQSLNTQKRGLELLLTIAQVSEFQLSYAEALKIYLDAIGQLFEGYYGLIFLRERESNDIYRATSISYFDDGFTGEDLLPMLSDKRLIDLREPLFDDLTFGACTIAVQDLPADLRIPLSDAGFLHMIYIPVRKGAETMAICEVPVRSWNATFDAYLSQAAAAALQLAVTLERSEAKRTIESNYVALQEAHDKLKTAQSQLVHSEKMASIGQLAAGVAHEINNPVGFVLSNIETLNDYLVVILKVLAGYEEYFKLKTEAGGNVLPTDYTAEQLKKRLESMKNKENFSFIIDDFDQIIQDSRSGLARVKDIVANLKSFARADSGNLAGVNLNLCIDDTIKVIWNELKYDIDLIKEYAELPLILCNASQISQVIMNLILNAKQAIKGRGKITIHTQETPTSVIISIKDTGPGIPAEIRERIFDPFFTTKPVNEGTGLGLSISYGIIQQHKGRLWFESRENKGTIFNIELPKRPEASAE